MSNFQNNPLLNKIKSEIDENKVLEELSKEYDVSELLSYNEFNVGEKLQSNAFYQEQFRLLYISEKQKLTRIQDKFNEMAGQKFDYYKYQDARDLTKTEIEKYYLPSDKELIKYKKLIELQNTRVEFFSALAEAFKSQGFNMRVFVDNLKIGG